MSTNPTPPALTPEEWEEVRTNYPCGQPYGFTWEDVDALRFRADQVSGDWGVPEYDAPDLLSLADRIAALLPPEDLTMTTTMHDNSAAEYRWRGRELITADDPRHPDNDPAYTERCQYCDAKTKPEQRQVCGSCWRLGG